MVECNLAKVKVAGSNPVSRSSFFCLFNTRGWQLKPSWNGSFLGGIYVPSLNPMGFAGGIAKWLRRRSAKPLFPGSNPGAASILPGWWNW